MKPVVCLLFLACCLSQLNSCSRVVYRAEPLSVAEVNQTLQQKSASSDTFKAYLIQRGIAESNWPIAQWELETLTHSALFHHTSLDLAKSKLASAEANVRVASQRPLPGIGGKIGQSNQANDDISPWVYGLQIDIPIVTANKREIRQEEAKQLAEVARIDLADAAWRLRQQLVIDLIDHEENQRNIEWLQQSVAMQTSLVKLLDKRLAAGFASSTELAIVSIELQKKQNLLNAEQARTSAILAKIAADAGLQPTQFTPTRVARLDTDQRIQQQGQSIKAGKLQEEALLNRLDIRRALANYAAAEARVKLEVAKQYPDITLSPSYMFEMGDRIWALGFSRLLNIIQPQQTALIRLAEQLRHVEAKQFEALQASVIANLYIAVAQHDAGLDKLKQLDHSKRLEQVQLARLLKQFEAGNLDRVEMTHAQLASLNTALQYQQIQFELLRTQATIENLLQKPLTALENLRDQGL